MFTTRSTKFIDRSELNDDQIRAVAPSVFAASPLPDVSERYAFVPTTQIVSRLRQSGWSPVQAHEQIVRLDGRRGFQKHLLRYQRRDVQAVAGEYSPELVLINSHDRSSAYQLHAGLFRFVCGNGMIVADATFERVSIRHSGFTSDEVIEASFKLLDHVPAITARVDAFKRRHLDSAEMAAFAEAALRLRFEDVAEAPISPNKLLDCRRAEDAGNDLWHVFNRLQEHLTCGGQRDWSRRREDGRRFPRTRAISGLDQNIRLNRELWNLAERVANHEAIILAE
ncbi:MAG TPA: DUF932 domain-containing protein [Candidatus Baltobacteraceae bacterium]|nr:DUF932 domain-containing protein [Candidatus Baltobacteraceae bacterium]